MSLELEAAWPHHGSGDAMVAGDEQTQAEEPSPDGAASALWGYVATALDGSRLAIAATDREGRYVWVLNPLPVMEGILGRTDDTFFPAEEAALLAGAKAKVLAGGEAQRLALQLGGESHGRWYDISIRPHPAEGAADGTVTLFLDITDRRVQEEHLRIVLRELAHRSKNLLAVIQGIARQTAERAASTRQFLNRFNGRIFSLSRAHDVLTEADWRGARIFDLVHSQVALYAEEKLPALTMSGENGFLLPNAAQYVGLALHELTTNALKYGALARDGGKVTVSFEPHGADAYRFTWEERGGAPVRAPRRNSFGLIMLKEVVPVSVSGSALLTFGPAGLRYQLVLPRAQLVS